jgi:L-asparagine oxygenase
MGYRPRGAYTGDSKTMELSRTRKAASLEEILRELGERGFHHSSCLEAGDLLDLCAQLGRPRGDQRDPRIIRTLSPQEPVDAPANTLSSRYGLGAFPFHTEVAYWRRPARYVVLTCIDPGTGCRPTLLCDGGSWQLTSAERRSLAEGVWKVSCTRPFLCSILSGDDGHGRIRFDADCMIPMTREARLAQGIVAERLEGSGRVEINWVAHDLLVIDNRRILHARGAAQARDVSRTLQRVLVEEITK